ncbi:hypothetical protein BS47DRAFT_1347665 [Hydnum rufescens UP504]|uniref:Uncharacterized protein n=1 Tax=Hydnum rufescens UP504 TaxID=1448309 RepID=A0A9P6ARP0_9AGAM|nr:hypothetical protein BS47DRAFT_1347665 [Hydnum rufescens UP504]
MTHRPSESRLRTPLLTVLPCRKGAVISNKAPHRTMELEERGLREEEDRAFREAATKDRERIHKSNRPSPVRSRRASTDRGEATASNNVGRSDDSCLWRSRYQCKATILEDTALRKFGGEDDLTALYTFVETLLSSSEYPKHDFPRVILCSCDIPLTRNMIGGFYHSRSSPRCASHP